MTELRPQRFRYKAAGDGRAVRGFEVPIANAISNVHGGLNDVELDAPGVLANAQRVSMVA